jgi:hypothetical protein
MTANDEAGRRGVFPAYVLLFATLYAGFGVMSPFLPALLQARGLRPEGIGLALVAEYRRSICVRTGRRPRRRSAWRIAQRLRGLRDDRSSLWTRFPARTQLFSGGGGQRPLSRNAGPPYHDRRCARIVRGWPTDREAAPLRIRMGARRRFSLHRRCVGGRSGDRGFSVST